MEVPVGLGMPEPDSKDGNLSITFQSFGSGDPIAISTIVYVCRKECSDAVQERLKKMDNE